MADPNGGNCIPNAGGSTATLAATGTCNLTAFNNAGQLPGVDVIQQALEYVQLQRPVAERTWFPVPSTGAPTTTCTGAPVV